MSSDIEDDPDRVRGIERRSEKLPVKHLEDIIYFVTLLDIMGMWNSKKKFYFASLQYKAQDLLLFRKFGHSLFIAIHISVDKVSHEQKILGLTSGRRRNFLRFYRREHP